MILLWLCCEIPLLELLLDVKRSRLGEADGIELLFGTSKLVRIYQTLFWDWKERFPFAVDI